MAMITDPDVLDQGVEVVINTGAKTIQLVKAGQLGDDGVTLQCLYSFLKEEWKGDAALIMFPFPMTAITEEKFELVNGWDFVDVTTKQLVRIGGWALKDSGGVSQEEYAGIITLGTLGGADQVYYQQSGSGAATNIVLPGVVNQAVKVYGDSGHGSFDYRAYCKVFCREYAKTYAMSQLSDIGVTTMTYQVYRFPLTNATDLKVVATDANVIGNTPYFATATDTGTDGEVTIGDSTFTVTAGIFEAGDVGKYICIDSGANMGFYKIITYTSATAVEVDRNFASTQSTITFSVNPAGMGVEWFAAAQQRSIGGTDYDFHVIVDANQGTAEQAYTFVQYQLRQNNDIDVGSGAKVGKVTSALLSFVGDSLYTLLFTTGSGTYIDDFQSSDTNRLYFTDDTGAVIQFPYVAVLTLNFGDNLKNDTAAKYWVFFTNDDSGSNQGYDYGTANAILVNKNGSVATVHRARASNIATIGTATAHGLIAGESVDVSDLGGTGYNGDHIVLSAPDSTHFTYANIGDPESEAADTGGTIRENMVGNVGGASSIQLSFDYDNNVQRGNTLPNAVPDDDAPLVVVALGLETGQFVKATGTITRSVANVVSLVAALERNYSGNG
jgi:hypothetical protein